jgi:oligopeptidase B
MIDETNRSFRIMKHVLGRPQEEDQLVYEESDGRFEVSLSKTNDQKYILILNESCSTTEMFYIDADHPSDCVRFAQREHGVKYTIEHHHGLMLIVTNYNGYINFRLMYAIPPYTEKLYWKEMLPYDPERYIETVVPYKDFLVSCERFRGLKNLRVLPWNPRGFSDLYAATTTTTTAAVAFEEERDLIFPDAVYTFSIDPEQSYVDNRLRLTYSSFITPDTVYDYDLRQRIWNVVKKTVVLGDFDTNQYETHRILATTVDGIYIPISLVHRKGLTLNGQNPTLLYGYGAYDYCVEPDFQHTRISYLDRGYVYAIAHVRGGSENGRYWYEDGKLLKKKNTFTDFIACIETLIARGYTQPDKLAIEGRSAGGLLIGAMVTLRPDLFKAALGNKYI